MPEYREAANRDPAILAAFVDPGPGFDPAEGPGAIWFQRVVENSSDLVVAFGHDGTIWYVNDAARVFLGYEPGELIGTSAFALVDPDDLHEAAETAYQAAGVEGWRPPRPFRLLRADGTSVTFEFEGISLYHVPEVQSVVVIGRHAEAAARVDRILNTLAAHRPLPEILDELVFLMHRPGWKLGVAIQYEAGDGAPAFSHSGLPPALCGPVEGIDDRSTPWARAYAAGELVVDVGLDEIDPQLRAVAEAEGFFTCWAVPVHDPAARRGACIVVWNAEREPPQVGQDKAFQRLRQLLGLALSARAQSEALWRAANRDALTGLANRHHYEERLAEMADGADVTVFFADLDGFKQINDRYGHHAGDEVLSVVGRRLEQAVRADDIAARFGGDEFALVCRDLSDAEAVAIAERLLVDVREPIELPSGPVQVGISIGIALPATDGAATEVADLLRVADRQLYAAKAEGRNCFRLARVGAPVAVSRD